MTEPTPVSGNPERFTASNGWTVENGNLENVEGQSEASFPGWPGWLALVEYGRHLERTERDAELGRWRSKKHPDYVVYRIGADLVRVVEEPTGRSDYYTVAMLQAATGAPGEVAREWFDAQESPKPWLSAVHGEAWVIVFDGHERVAVVDDGYFVWAGGDDGYPLDYELITAGRRIWPEPEEES